MRHRRQRADESENGFTLVEMLVVVLITGVLVLAVMGILVMGMKTFQKGGGNYAAAGEMAIFSHYFQNDVASTQPDSVTVGGFVCGTSSTTTTGNTLDLAWTDPSGVYRRVAYSISGDALLRTATIGSTTSTSAFVLHHLNTGVPGGAVVFTCLTQAGEVQALVNLSVAMTKGGVYTYQGSVTGYEQAMEGLQGL